MMLAWFVLDILGSYLPTSTGGYRIAITDFGLAVIEKLSEEFRTGSVSYESKFVAEHLLVHLLFPQNKTASLHLRDRILQCPMTSGHSESLTTVLRISTEFNVVLVRMLELVE
ncbi:hypothetical protein K438DRAFT_1025703 [Mycena galopus ATCC 62051]|nr:hypothetical protein K438DRAFT_1025703 [Mycena galopus ATCC 62051]